MKRSITGLFHHIEHQWLLILVLLKTSSLTIIASAVRGNVSQELRWVSLNINQKLLSRAVFADNTIFVLLKGHLQGRNLHNIHKKALSWHLLYAI